MVYAAFDKVPPVSDDTPSPVDETTMNVDS